MLTVQKLSQWGAHTEEGVARCMNNETFYLMLVKKMQQDASMQKLKEALARDDLDTAFEAAHALKGVLANLALTPALEPVSELTELLRARTQADYSELTLRAEAAMRQLQEMINEA